MLSLSHTRHGYDCEDVFGLNRVIGGWRWYRALNFVASESCYETNRTYRKSVTNNGIVLINALTLSHDARRPSLELFVRALQRKMNKIRQNSRD